MVQGQDSNCSLCQVAKCPGGLQKLQESVVAGGADPFTHILGNSRKHNKIPSAGLTLTMLSKPQPAVHFILTGHKWMLFLIATGIEP